MTDNQATDVQERPSGVQDAPDAAGTPPETLGATSGDTGGVTAGKEVVLHNPNASPLQRPPQSIDEIVQLVDVVGKSNLIPKAFRGKPADMIIAGLMGAEQGWPFMTSLRYIHVIEGKPTFSSEAMGAKIHQAGHALEIDVTDDRAVVVGTRSDTGKSMRYTYSLADAKLAGLLGKDNWKMYPKAMLIARAVAQVARNHFGDVMMGMGYTPEEMGDESWVPAPAEVLEAHVGEEFIPSSSNLAENVVAACDALSADSRGKIDGWVKAVTDADGEVLYPGGVTFESLDGAPTEFLERINQMAAKARFVERDTEVEEVIEDAVIVADYPEDEEFGISEAEAAQTEQDDADDAEIYAFVTGTWPDGQSFSPAALKNGLGWEGTGAVLRSRAGLARQVDYGNLVALSDGKYRLPEDSSGKDLASASTILTKVSE